MEKKYYWIKLKNTLLTSDKVDFLMSQKDGANYVVLYQCLCLMCVNSKGQLGTTIGEVLIPYDVAKIQRETKWFTQDTVRVALELYKQLGLIYQLENGLYQITDFENLIGSETKWAEYKRLAKSKKDDENWKISNESPTDFQQEKDIRYKRLDKEKEKEKETNKEKKRKESDDLLADESIEIDNVVNPEQEKIEQVQRCLEMYFLPVGTRINTLQLKMISEWVARYSVEDIVKKIQDVSLDTKKQGNFRYLDAAIKRIVKFKEPEEEEFVDEISDEEFQESLRILEELKKGRK